MALSELQQVFELVRNSRQILIIYRKDWTGDAVAGSLALAEFLVKIGKVADIVCQDFKATSGFGFLPVNQIRPAVSQNQKLTVSIDLTQVGLDEFKYEHVDNKLNLFITPKSGGLTQDNISSSVAGYKYDLIILVNTPDLQSLGEAYTDNSDFFYAVPKINIDHSSANEYFGNINLINLAVASTSEIIYELIASYDHNLIDHNIATYLLSGIISSTKNFKTTTVTPRTLSLASELITRGARRDQIVQSFYQSRFLTTLKLWGRVLSRLNNDLNDKIIWSKLTVNDFIETSTSVEELPEVVDELISSMPKTEVIVLFYEFAHSEQAAVQVIVYAFKNHDAISIARKFNPLGNQEVVKFVIKNTKLVDAESLVIDEIKNKLLAN